MPFLNELAVLEQRFKAQFENVYTSVVCRYENQPTFKRPDKDISYVEFFVIPGYGNPITLGPNIMERRTGLIQVNIYVPVGKGSASAKVIADNVETIFRMKDITIPSTNDLVRTRTSRLKPVGERDGHYCEVLTIPYQYDSF